MGIDLDLGSILRRISRSEDASVTLSITSPGVMGDHVERAARAALRHADSTTGLDSGGYTVATHAECLIPLHGMIDAAGWLRSFADALAESGVEAQVTVAPSAPVPDWFERADLWPAVGVWVAHRAGDAGSADGWGPARACTEAVVDHAASWVEAVDADPEQSRVVIDAVPVRQGPPFAEALRYGARRGRKVGVYGIRRHPRRARLVTLCPRGEISYQDLRDTPPAPIDQLADIRALLLRSAATSDLGIARLTVGIPGCWSGTGFGMFPSPPYIDMFEWLRCRQLWSQYVPDAYASQLLTTSHLDRSHDLSDWNVTRAGSDRWLVETRHHEAWLGSPPMDQVLASAWPPPDVLESARSSFGDMLIRPADIQPSPAPG